MATPANLLSEDRRFDGAKFPCKTRLSPSKSSSYRIPGRKSGKYPKIMPKTWEELEVIRQSIAEQRGIMEQKDRLRETTLSEFAEIHHRSLIKAIEQQQRQMEVAKQRNEKLLKDAQKTKAALVHAASISSSPTVERLKSARDHFFMEVEDLLPEWQHKMMTTYANKLEEMERTQVEVERRRLVATEVFEKEQVVQEVLQKKRQELSLSQVLLKNEELERSLRRRSFEQNVHEVDKIILEKDMQVTGGGKRKQDTIPSNKQSDEDWKSHVVTTLESVNNTTPSSSLPSSNNEDYYNQLHQQSVNAQKEKAESTRSKALVLTEHLASSAIEAAQQPLPPPPCDDPHALWPPSLKQPDRPEEKVKVGAPNDCDKTIVKPPPKPMRPASLSVDSQSSINSGHSTDNNGDQYRHVQQSRNDETQEIKHNQPVDTPPSKPAVVLPITHEEPPKVQVALKTVADMTVAQRLQVIQRLTEYLEFSAKYVPQCGYSKKWTPNLSHKAWLYEDQLYQIICSSSDAPLLTPSGSSKGGGDEYIAGEVVLHIIHTLARDLIPLDLLNGLVDAEKVTKYHRKIGKVADVWSVIIRHVERLTKDMHMTSEEVVQIFTEPLLAGDVDNNRTDTQRYRRKLVSIIESMCSKTGNGDDGEASPAVSRPSTHSPQKSSISLGDGVMMLSSRSKSNKRINISRSSSIGMSISKVDELEDDGLTDLDSLLIGGGGGSVMRSPSPESGATNG